MVYPVYAELQRLVPTMIRGNFGLWYNKLVPLNNFNECKTSDQIGNDKNAISHYYQQYNNTDKINISSLLNKKHRDQAQFCLSLSPRFETVVLKAELKSPLITGIGESHPHEVSMVFDHNMGIPYIPASGIKGIVRFAHMLGLLDGIAKERKEKDKDGRQFLDEEKDWTNVPQLFGTQKKQGSVIFMDAYPEIVPELHVDIMNPHYGKYYSDDQNQTPPGDYLAPNPIKFLTVSKGTAFIFRALVDRKNSGLIDKVKTAFKKTLTEEGVGAKTAVGYGIFDHPTEEESKSVLDFMTQEKERKAREAEEAIAQVEAKRRQNLSEDERMVEDIKRLKGDPSKIAALVTKCLQGGFNRSVYQILENGNRQGLNRGKPK